jgi:hypothetical protein
MEGIGRKRQRACLGVALGVGAVLLGIGCNPLTLSYFLFAPEHRESPLCKLASPDKEVKVVIVVAHADLPPAGGVLSRADEELSWLLTRMLEAQFKENEEKVKIVTPTQVRAYQHKNHRWRDEPPQQIGKHFKADYVINLEINGISLADRTDRGFYRGRADISVTVTDVSKPVGEGEIFPYPYTVEYPKGKTIELNEMPPAKFCALFLARIAKDLTYTFAAHAPREKYSSD